MRETFSAGNGYRLLLEDGQQKQANQIMAIRTFIQQDVDYIVLAPVVETGEMEKPGGAGCSDSGYSGGSYD